MLAMLGSCGFGNAQWNANSFVGSNIEYIGARMEAPASQYTSVGGPVARCQSVGRSVVSVPCLGHGSGVDYGTVISWSPARYPSWGCVGSFANCQAFKQGADEQAGLGILDCKWQALGYPRDTPHWTHLYCVHAPSLTL